jgi:16S rRNA (cytidine1402-2'-O)-methyltransferase
MATLYIVATPIGNLEDISLRAIKTLLNAPVVACEDTRHTGQLLKILSDSYPEIEPVERKYISIRDWNEADMVANILLELVNGKDVALVSDAGTPLISDPGFKLGRGVREAGFTVVPIPGASAAIVALSASGLPTDKFTFRGFWKDKYEIAPATTTIFYESPERINLTLAKIREKYPSAQIVVASELTKIHERIFLWTGEEITTKGEHTILVYFQE